MHYGGDFEVFHIGGYFWCLIHGLVLRYRFFGDRIVLEAQGKSAGRRATIFLHVRGILCSFKALGCQVWFSLPMQWSNAKIQSLTPIFYSMSHGKCAGPQLSHKPFIGKF